MEGSAPPPPRHRILVGVTGSVAAIKLQLLAEELLKQGDVRVVSTSCAEHFWRGLTLPPEVTVYRDRDEWSTWQRMGDEVLHIELRKWADVFVVAPLDANSLAKMAGGLCDNLVTSVARCWDVARGTMLVAPAMNTVMWTHPVTAGHLETLGRWNVGIIPPVSKTLACGDVGVGAMASVPEIAAAVAAVLSRSPQ
jgi:phosphopantothenoylcysteine decarboxylase